MTGARAIRQTLPGGVRQYGKRLRQYGSQYGIFGKCFANPVVAHLVALLVT